MSLTNVDELRIGFPETLLDWLSLDSCSPDCIGHGVIEWPCGLAGSIRFLSQQSQEGAIIRAAHQYHHDQGHSKRLWTLTDRINEQTDHPPFSRTVTAYCDCEET